jgi:Bacterial SH3 domain
MVCVITQWSTFMLPTRPVIRLIVGLLALVLSACTLSTAPRQPTEAPTQAIIIVPTNAPLATSTPQPTLTPLPTNTSIPVPTATPVYIVSHLGPGPVCSLTPTVAGANIRSGPGTNYPIIGVLPAANWVSAVRLDGSGWYQISFPGTPVEGGWMSNTVVALQQPCVCGPNNCVAVTTPYPTFTPQPQPTATFPPDQCMLTLLTASDVVGAYTQPTLDQSPEFNLTPAHRLQVVGRTADGWYGVVRGNSQAALVGIYTLVWIRSDARITLTGAPCGQLKIIDLSYPPPASCTVSPANTSSIPVYMEYDFSVAPAGTLSGGVSASVVGKSAAGIGGVTNGWYAIEPSIAQAGNVGKYRLRWVPIDNTVQTSGDCSALPTISLDP